jgi:hypothetical protein
MSDTPDPVGPNSIRADLDADGELILYCGSEAFARLRDLLAAEAADTNSLPADPGEIESIVVVRDEPVPESPADQTPIDATWRNTVPMVGCLFVMAALFAVFCAGLVTVVRWLFW